MLCMRKMSSFNCLLLLLSNRASHQSIDAKSNQISIKDRLTTSVDQLNGLLSDGGILIGNVKVANERREIRRKQIESGQRMQLLDDVQHESDEAANKLAAIKSRWSELTEISDPIDLNERLRCQNERIKGLMQQKDAIVGELQQALVRANERYNIDQAKQAADIECLIERIDEQIDVMKNVYLEHLELLHHSIDCEQRMFKAFHTNEWQDLYDERTGAEEQHLDAVLQRQQQFYAELSTIQLHHEEVNRDMRIKFDRDNDLVQQKLEEVKADIRLNTEQLNYNHFVLQKRAAENTQLRTKQKNRLIRMRTCLAALRKQTADTRSAHATEMKKQTQYVLGAYANIGDLELKMRAFAERNDENVHRVYMQMQLRPLLSSRRYSCCLPICSRQVSAHLAAAQQHG